MISAGCIVAVGIVIVVASACTAFFALAALLLICRGMFLLILTSSYAFSM
jgi:hypothetical protein